MHFDASSGTLGSTTQYIIQRQEYWDLQLSNANLPELFSTTVNYIDEGIIIAQQIQRADYTGTVIEEVYYIRTDQYNEELREVGGESLEKLYHQVACLQQKSFSNMWTNAVMHKFSQANIANSSNLRTYIIQETLNPRLKNCGASGLHPTT